MSNWQANSPWNKGQNKHWMSQSPDSHTSNKKVAHGTHRHILHILHTSHTLPRPICTLVLSYVRTRTLMGVQDTRTQPSSVSSYFPETASLPLSAACSHPFSRIFPLLSSSSSFLHPPCNKAKQQRKQPRRLTMYDLQEAYKTEQEIL